MLKRKMVVALAVTTAACSADHAVQQPFNSIAVVIDASGSYRARQQEAVAKTGALLAQLTKRKPKRWETPDQIYVISLDASPEVIWQGSPEKLAKTGLNDWAARFRSRLDYAGCTDVARALNLAVQQLQKGDPTNRYLFGFSDLLDEKPTHGASRCARAQSVPESTIDWDGLKPISMSVFWMPIEQKMAWDAAMREKGLATYRLYSVSESAANDIEIPDPAQRKVTEKDRQQARDRLWAWVGAAGKTMVAAFTLLCAVTVGGIVMRRRRRGDQPRAGGVANSAARSGVRVRGPVAPLRLPPQR